MKLKLNGVLSFVNEAELNSLGQQILQLSKQLHSRTSKDFLGWVDLPKMYDREEFARIQTTARRIQSQCSVFIVIGVGGSYLGSRSAIEFVKGQHYNDDREKHTPDIFFVGNNLSSAYLHNIIHAIGDRDFCINVISKSGQTLEPAIAFRIFKKLMVQKYGVDESRKRIYITTDKQHGALKTYADSEGCETFVVPDDIGGRYSVLTAVGLLPMAVAGLDLDAVMHGAQDARTRYQNDDIHTNDCFKYVALRNLLYQKGKTVEVLASYDPSLSMLGRWFQQLFAESEGKNHKGVFPVTADFTTDLHSFGQFIQDGTRNMFETILWIKESKDQILIDREDNDFDGLNYLAGRSLQFINQKAYEGTAMAHVHGGTPNIVFEIPRADEYYFGFLVYFFETACSLSCYLLGVNPFDQPGVEEYKTRMFTLLGRPGYGK